MGNYHPPYEITDKILMLTASIAEKSGRIMERYHGGNAAMDKEGRIRAVHAVLETEGNRLSVGEMREDYRGKSDIGKREANQGSTKYLCGLFIYRRSRPL